MEPPAGKLEMLIIPFVLIKPTDVPIGPVTDKLTKEPMAPGKPKLVGNTERDSTLPRQMGELVTALRIGATTDKLSKLGNPTQVPLLQSMDKLWTPKAEVEIGIVPKSGKPGKPNVVPTGHKLASDKVLPIKVVSVLGVDGVAGIGRTDTGSCILTA